MRFPVFHQRRLTGAHARARTAVLWGLLLASINGAQAAGVIDIRIEGPNNLFVDNNVLSTSTAAPGVNSYQDGFDIFFKFNPGSLNNGTEQLHPTASLFLDSIRIDETLPLEWTWSIDASLSGSAQGNSNFNLLTPVEFDFGTSLVTLQALSGSATCNSCLSGQLLTGELDITYTLTQSVSEPVTISLLFAGLLLGIWGRRGQRQTSP